jgi:uncharacterized membrane protein (DUF485 family)
MLLIFVVAFLPKVNPGMISDESCKAGYLFQVFSLSSTWILTFMTTQKTNVLYCPFQENAVKKNIKLTGTSFGVYQYLLGWRAINHWMRSW